MDAGTLQTVQMNWGQVLSIIGSILIPMAGFFLWSRKDIKDDIKELKNDLKKEIGDVKESVKNIDTRLTRLEGRFEERGQWESKIYKVEKTIVDHPHQPGV